jgi:hypothetical protein
METPDHGFSNYPQLLLLPLLLNTMLLQHINQKSRKTNQTLSRRFPVFDTHPDSIIDSKTNDHERFLANKSEQTILVHIGREA